ncbi:MAG: diaminopimelate decarboxylase [Rhodocyclaceae bacterium]|nr:diaminopimelate decarboxylase [Rhodocyclaceae bacterium]
MTSPCLDLSTPHLTRTAQGLQLEGVPLAELAARYGTPLYVYSRAAIEDAFSAWQQATRARESRVHYAVKANSNLAILSLFARRGAGFDIVSGGELARVLAAGGEAGKTVFSGVAKSEAEILAALEAGIGCFDVESLPELERIARIATETGRVAPIALRVNPDIDARTHPYISTGLKHNKFGIAWTQARKTAQRAAALPGIHLKGIACHIGSQLLQREPIEEAAARLLELADQLAADGIALEHINLGGGLGVRYQHDERPPTPADYLARVLARFAGRRERLDFEPGRSLIAPAGLLLTRIEYIKHGEAQHFLLVDAAMNDYIRPALYEAWNDVVEVAPGAQAAPITADIAGPVCESTDVLARARTLTAAAGDVLAILATGAYGMSMASNYNSRPRPAEVLVDGEVIHLIRARETLASLYAGEAPLP